MAGNQAAFAAGVLKGVGAPVTPQNIAGIIGWAQAEGGWSHNNPLNTTQSAPGASNFNSVGVKTYPNLQVGVQATVQTLKNGRYGQIIGALRSGNVHALPGAIGSSPWGTSGSLAAQTISQALRQPFSVPPNAGAGMTAAPQAPAAGSLSQTVPTFNQAGYDKANARYIAGSFIAGQKNPFDIGPKGASLGPNPVFSPGGLTTAAPNAADYQGTKTIALAQTGLQALAGQTPLNTHPALHGQGDFATPAPQKIVDMQGFAKQLIGAPYSQANHAASYSQGVNLIKKYGTDCSGLVSILLGRAGVLKGPQTTETLAAQPGIQAGRGQHVTIFNRSGAGSNSHMIIQIGKDWFESGGRVGRGVVQMSAIQAQQELGGGGFAALHPQGF